MTTSDPSSHFVGPDQEPDKFRLLAQVGSGGEAQLWQAELRVGGGTEPVAIKMQHDRGRDARSEARWAEQAEVLRFIAHPGVVGVREYFQGARLHRAGEAGRQPGRVLYLVMNWVDGTPLDEWSMVHRDAPDRLPRALRHLGQAADVLDWLHSGQATPSGRPVVHGDLSPGNVMITASGQAMLVDFGLVRLATHETSHVVGTPGYTAPEVWHSGRYSPESDRFSFGAIAYFTLLGEGPPPDPDVVRAELSRSPLLAKAAPDRVDRLMTMFSPYPSERPTAAAWLRDLREAALSTTGPSSRPVARTYVPAAVGGGAAPGRPTVDQGHRAVDPCRPTVAPGAAAPVAVPPQRAGGSEQAPARPRRRWRRTKATVGTVVLLAVLGGGIYLGNRFSDGFGSVPTAVGPTTGAPAPANGSADPGAPPELTPETVAVRRSTGSTPIRLTSNYSVDIDSLAPDWDVSTSSSEKDLSLDGSRTLYAYGSSDLAPVASATPDVGVCQAATNYSSSIDLTNGQPRTSYCLRTSQKRYALITLENAESPLVIDVTVWDPPRR